MSVAVWLLFSGCSPNGSELVHESSIFDSSAKEQIVDLENVQGAKVTHTFRIKNSGSGPVVISSVVKNCSCTITSVKLGVCIESGEEFPVSVTLNGRASGGMEVGELRLETTSKSMEVRTIQLRLEANFSKMFWTEFAELDGENDRSVIASRFRLYCSDPEIFSKFVSVTVKPEVVALVQVERSNERFLEFEFEANVARSEDWANVFAIFKFDDSRVPVHTELVPNPYLKSRL